MKKTVRVIAGLVLAVSLVSVSFVACKKKAEGKSKVIGVLSYLNMTEEQYHQRMEGSVGIVKILEERGYFRNNGEEASAEERKNFKVRYYDTLDSLIMALKSKEIYEIGSLPKITALYLCSRDPDLKLGYEFDIEKHLSEPLGVDEFVDISFSRLGDGFSFMMLEKNTALRDQFNDVISEMRKDGSLEALIREQILGPKDGGEVKATLPEQKEGRKTIKVAVTGSLPPMDYVSADGTFAGFNTALLAEIGKRLDVNVSMVQVSSVGRASALASGTVDVVFWTRSAVTSSARMLLKSDEEFNDVKKKLRDRMTKEEDDAMIEFTKSIIGTLSGDTRKVEANRDMPEGTIVTIPYFSSIPVSVVLKK